MPTSVFISYRKCVRLSIAPNSHKREDCTSTSNCNASDIHPIQSSICLSFISGSFAPYMRVDRGIEHVSLGVVLSMHYLWIGSLDFLVSVFQQLCCNTPLWQISDEPHLVNFMHVSRPANSPG